MEKSIRFYKPSEKFKNTNEMVVVGTEKDVLATFGSHGDIGNEKDLINWIDTSAQAVMFLMSFQIMGLFLHCSVTMQMVEDIKKEIKTVIKEYIERANTGLSFHEKRIIGDKIYERIEELIK